MEAQPARARDVHSQGAGSSGGLAPAQDLAPNLERCFLFEAVEGSYDITGIRGRVPEWLRGTCYVNGPARFQYGGARYRHWLDGDGMVCAWRFGENGIRFTNRFVETQKHKDEREAGRFLYRGFGTSFAGDRLRRDVMIEPPVNVSVYPYAGTLLALGEQTLPMELDPVTLETRGEYTFQQRINTVSPFAAHAKIDPASGHLVNFGISYAAAQPALHLYEFDSGGGLVRRRRYALDAAYCNHDFGITPRSAVFFLGPLLMDYARFYMEGASVMESLNWCPERSGCLIVMPRASETGEPFAVPIGPAYALHLINCFDEGERLTVDLLELEEPVYRHYEPVPDLFRDSPRCWPARYVIDRAKRAIVEHKRMDYDLTSDFPAIDSTRLGATYDDFWMLGISPTGRAGRKFFDQLAHGKWSAGSVHDIYQVPKGEYLGGEPLFIKNPRDPHDAVIACEYLQPAEDRASMVLFDAGNVKAGPVATLPLRNRLHPGFHSSFAPASA